MSHRPGPHSHWILLLAVVLAAPPTRAQQTAGAAPTATLPGAGTLSDTLTGTAKEDYASAKLLYEDGDYRGALLKLKSAHEVSTDPRLLWNMAACEKNLRHYAEVARLVELYLAEGGAVVNEQDRADAQELLKTVKEFVTDLTVDVNEAGATILVDEQPVAQSPMAVAARVDMGQHLVRVKKQGFVDFTVTQELPGGQAFKLSATLVAAKHEGHLRVVAGSSDVIQVDHASSKVGLWDGVLPSGTHAVLVTAKGKEPHQTDVIVQDNDLTNLHVTLQDEPKAASKGVPTWVWIAGGAALVAGGVGTYFLLKPEPTTNYQNGTPGTWGIIEI